MSVIPRPKTPNGLEKAGKRLWRAVLDEFDLDARELLVLEQADGRRTRSPPSRPRSRPRDSSPVARRGSFGLSQTVTELRRARLAVSRLLGGLALPDSDEELAASRRGQAAEARWNRPRGS